MKTKFITAVVLTCFTLALNAAPGNQQPHKGSPEFERMKSLVGSWKGKMTMPNEGKIDITVSYRVLAGGSAIEERTFAGTPKEMVTMYYDQGGKLALTHYCSLGNRPTMAMKSSDKKSITFDFDEVCGIDPKKESHMHALKIVFNNKNTITTEIFVFSFSSSY